MHYYQFNIGDYKSHTEHLSEMEDLAYRRLLDWYYLHESPIPLDIDEVARQIRMRSHTDCIAIVLREFFEQTKKGWVSHRADEEIAKVSEKSQKAKASADARWGKKSNKNKDNSKTTMADANALPTQSESNATQDTRHITQDTKKERATGVACPPDVSPQVWQDWLQLRKTKKASVTETVVKGARAEASKLSWTLEQFLVEWCTRGSQGLKAEWLQEKMTATQKAAANMNLLTRGMSGPKPAPFWAKPDTQTLEVIHDEPKRIL
jgi:uncharacterized protein YdaU (DUF1376 family)